MTTKKFIKFPIYLSYLSFKCWVGMLECLNYHCSLLYFSEVHLDLESYERIDIGHERISDQFTPTMILMFPVAASANLH